MVKFAVLAGSLAAVVAGAASADTTISLGNNSLAGSQSNSYSFNLTGNLSDFQLDVDYVDGNSASWASDMIIQIIDPNGVNRYWGGSNVVPAGSSFIAAWSFSGSGSTASGHYTDAANLGAAGLGGNGSWTFIVHNGWSGATLPCQYNNLTLALKGTIVPAPGAIALLGLAGLVGRRRRA